MAFAVNLEVTLMKNMYVHLCVCMHVCVLDVFLCVCVDVCPCVFECMWRAEVNIIINFYVG